MELLEKVVDHMDKQNLIIRAMGAAAIRRHSEHFYNLHHSFRKLSDVDFVTYSKQVSKIEKAMAELGFRARPVGVTPEIFAKRRIVYYDLNGETIWTDIFIDTLEMNHMIDFRGRLERDHPTIPLAELFLQKAQIVRINEKDLKDLCVLLLDHAIDKGDNNTINASYIADKLSKDWGFYYTVTTNIDKLQKIMQNWTDIFTDTQLKTIGERAQKLRNEIETKDKSLSWKIRAKVGTKAQWYNSVEEVERAEHLEDLT
jgi:hypothetical protein